MNKNVSLDRMKFYGNNNEIALRFWDSVDWHTTDPIKMWLTIAWSACWMSPIVPTYPFHYRTRNLAACLFYNYIKFILSHTVYKTENNKYGYGTKPDF
jgi:hypothetical protein